MTEYCQRFGHQWSQWMTTEDHDGIVLPIKGIWYFYKRNCTIIMCECCEYIEQVTPIGKQFIEDKSKKEK